jgi:hypothetical protein
VEFDWLRKDGGAQITDDRPQIQDSTRFITAQLKSLGNRPEIYLVIPEVRSRPCVTNAMAGGCHKIWSHTSPALRKVLVDCCGMFV